MKKGDTVYYVNYKLSGELQLYKATVIGEYTKKTMGKSYPAVRAQINEVIFDNKFNKSKAPARHSSLVKKYIFTERTLPKYKLMHWLFTVGIK